MWETAVGICGKRLELFIPDLAAKLQEWEEIRITTHFGKQLCAMSASTIARVLRPYKGRGLRRPLSTTKPGEPAEGSPGFAEMNLVATVVRAQRAFISTP